MEGLLQWAADVVGANGSSSPPRDDEEDHHHHHHHQQTPFRFTAEQQEYVRSLDVKAASLQRSLRQLRGRIPSDASDAAAAAAHAFPFLHADSAASKYALTMELDAHRATLAQAQMREASLQAENEAYLKAMETVKRQTKEKSQEAIRFLSRFKELEARDEKLKIDLERLQTLSENKEQVEQGSELDTEGGEHIKLAATSMEEKAFSEAEELKRTKEELKLWETKLDHIEEEWEMLQQSSVRWSSPAQRENELERRLRSLSEQLMAKQVQAEQLANERDTLDIKLSRASEAHHQLVFSDLSGNVKGNKVCRNELPSSSCSSSRSFMLQSQIESHSAYMDSRRVAHVGVAYNLGRFCNRLNFLKNKQSRVTMALRVFAAAYVLGLHIIVFFVISLWLKIGPLK